MAFIIDDERAWQNIISRWLKEIGFEIKIAGDIKSAHSLLSNIESNEPQLILLDISLDRLDGSNVDGLSLIEKSRKISDNVKIIILTGFKNRSTQYQNDVDLIIEKVSEGQALTKAFFFEKIKELSISPYLNEPKKQ